MSAVHTCRGNQGVAQRRDEVNMSAGPTQSRHGSIRAIRAPFALATLALVTLLALALPSPAQAANCPNDGVVGPGEQCDGTAFGGYFGVPSCDAACGAGMVGAVACTAKCTIDCSGCTSAAPDAALPPDSSPPDMFPDVTPPEGWLAPDTLPATEAGIADTAP
jgi:hypothetical protein